MDKKNLLLGIIIVFTVFILSFFLIFNTNNTNGENADTTVMIKKSDFILVEDSNIYLNIQSIANDYISNLNGNNYLVDYIYSSCIDNKCIYLVTGFEQENFIISEEDNQSFNRSNLKILIDKNKYDIELVDQEIEDYLSDFTIKSDFVINGAYEYIEKKFTEENRLSFYLARYINYLNYDKFRAFNLLTDNMKNYYGNYQNFVLNVEYLINHIKTTILTYNKTKNNNTNVYFITDTELNKINIYEENIMNVKIEFEFN